MSLVIQFDIFFKNTLKQIQMSHKTKGGSDLTLTLSDNTYIELPRDIFKNGRQTFRNLGNIYDSSDVFIIKWDETIINMCQGIANPNLLANDENMDLNSAVFESNTMFIALNMDDNSNSPGFYVFLFLFFKFFCVSFIFSKTAIAKKKKSIFV